MPEKMDPQKIRKNLDAILNKATAKQLLVIYLASYEIVKKS